MPRRTATRTVTSSATPQAPTVRQQLQTPYDSNIYQLRRHWKWAAFSQFFFTFSPLLAMADVTLIDVENDLVHSTNRVLPRVMQRLLITLTQDRKITTESWQNVLRRQYQRRDPQASPIGLPARSQHYIVESSRASTAPPGASLLEGPLLELQPENEPSQPDQPVPSSEDTTEGSVENPEDISTAPKVEEEDIYETLEPLEKQVDWLDLSMLAKLDSLHILAEWQFQNPNRVRQQMKTDDEQASWRIGPVGYDAKSNAYWFIGGDRLWIQREPPRLNLKRKRKPGGNSRNTVKEQPQPLATKRQRIGLNPGTPEKPSAARSTRRKTQPQPSPGSREGRAAKTRANQRLDAQARDLAEFQRQMASSRTRPASTSPRKPTGIRVSARLRGATVEDDEWQEIPDEWLGKSDTHKSYVNDPPSIPLPAGKERTRTGLENDESSVSELTELSDGEDDTERAESDSDEKLDAEEASPTPAEDEPDLMTGGQQDGDTKFTDLVTTLPPNDFVEWETICVTLEEWESIGQQFEKATHYAEKALHKVLSQYIVPMVTAELREVEKKRRIEDAVVHRKRSSRIAMKESEKEEERAAMRKRVEEQEKMSRARRFEARQQKEQVERLRRENAREQRRKERELREQQSAEAQEAEIKPDVTVDVLHEGTSIALLPAGQSKVSTGLSVPINGTGSGSRSPVENWELDCEVCGRKGINQDDGVPLLCCGVCGKWQHIICHDKQDTMTGHARRNWDTEDFICRQCRLITSRSSSLGSSTNFISHGVNGKRVQASSTQGYYGQASNHPRSHPNTDYYQNPPSNTRYPYDRPDIQTAAASPSSRSHIPLAPSTGVTFAHYQPQQGGFSTSRPTYSVQDPNPSQHARYTIAPHGVPATGVTPYPSTFHAQPIAHSSAHVHEQWPSYPRTANSYPVNGGSPLRTQGVQSYYNGHAHASYSQMRGTTNPTVLRQYAGLQHVPSYQHSE